MPLRDHFRPPVSNRASWEELHGQWPAVIVQQLKKRLPPGFVAAPKVHLGTQIEIDVATFEADDSPPLADSDPGGGVATATWAPPLPSLAVESEPPDLDEYEVRVYDATRGRRLVAAIEIVSPANKDRPEHRNTFIAKCAALMHQGVAVSVVDLVTTRQFNLYTELLAFLGQSDPTAEVPSSALYAASCRWVKRNKRSFLEAWSHLLIIGQPLPTLPLWLSDDLSVPLDLEQSYEAACGDLSIL